MKDITSKIAMLETVTQQLGREQESMKGSISQIGQALDGKVSWKAFVWLFGVFYTILATVLGLIYNDLAKVRETTIQDHASIAKIEGILSNAIIHED